MTTFVLVLYLLLPSGEYIIAFSKDFSTYSEAYMTKNNAAVMASYDKSKILIIGEKDEVNKK